MVTLTDIDIIQLLRKNNLNQDTLQEDVVEKLSQKGLKVATAESCTGGLLSERITRVSGSSEVFGCGVCTYGNAIKGKGARRARGDTRHFGRCVGGNCDSNGGGCEKAVGRGHRREHHRHRRPHRRHRRKARRLGFMGVCTKEKAYAVKLMLGGVNISKTHAPISASCLRRGAVYRAVGVP